MTEHLPVARGHSCPNRHMSTHGNPSKANPTRWRQHMVAGAWLALAAVATSGAPHALALANGDRTEQGLELWPEGIHLGDIGPQKGIEAKISKIIEGMSLEQKIGQMVQGEIKEVTPNDIRRYHLGSVLNGGGSFPNNNEKATVADWLQLADRYWQAGQDVGIPIIWGTDAVHGHNNVAGATLFPHNIGLGAANNPELMTAMGQVVAKEVATTGIDWTFAPTLAVARDLRWGRTYESFSEDPEIVQQLGSHMVQGLQLDLQSEATLVATAKHFIGDGGTLLGDDQGLTTCDEAELAAVHGRAYHGSMAAGVQTVMITYSSWNDQKVHGNSYLITNVLKERMGFDGLVISDWNAIEQIKDCTISSCPQAVNAGIDMVMISARASWQAWIQNTIAQVRDGQIAMERIDDAVRRILRVKIRSGLYHKPKPSHRPFAGQQELVGHDSHRQLAREAVRQSLVLMKNNNQQLPLNPTQKILVTGKSADLVANQSGGWSLTWQGVNPEGGGLPNDAFPGATSIYQAIKAESPKATLDTAGESIANEAYDVAVVVIGETPYAEGKGDLQSALGLDFGKLYPEDARLLQRLKGAGIPTVTVFLSGRPLYVTPELNASDAFVAAWLPGSEGAGVTDLLFANKGSADFVGKLPYAWPATPCASDFARRQQPAGRLFVRGYGLTYQDNVTVGSFPEHDTTGTCDFLPEEQPAPVSPPSPVST